MGHAHSNLVWPRKAAKAAKMTGMDVRRSHVDNVNPARHASWISLRLVLCVLSAALSALSVFPVRACPEQAIVASQPLAILPEAPTPQGTEQRTSSPPQAIPEPATLSGTVSDQSGAAVAGARVTLVPTRVTKDITALSDANGKFTFSMLAPGRYRLSAAAGGFATYVSTELTLAAGESRNLQQVVLQLASSNSVVEVFAGQRQIAEAQVHLAEKQRVLGVVPNFYSSYIWNAVPLTPRLKTGLAFRSILDPVAFIAAGGLAGVEQYHNTFPGYGRGTQGYLRRYGAAYADGAVDRLLGSAVFPTLFHQDPRYFYKGDGSIRSRAIYALEATVITRGDNGRQQPNYSHILGNFAASGVSNLYRDPQDRTASLTFRNGLIITGTNAATNLIREFLLRRFTHNVPVTSGEKH